MREPVLHGGPGARRARWRRIGLLLLLGALAFLVGALAALFLLPEARRQMLPRQTEASAAIGGPFSLLDHTGRRVTQADFRGRFMLVTFGTADAADPAAARLQVMAAALDRLGSRADRVVPVFVTLDPEREGPAELAAWVRRFHPRLVGLTGTTDAVAAMARAWKLPLRRGAERGRAEALPIDGPAPIYLMGPDGYYIAHFGSSAGVAEIAHKLALELT